MLRPTRISPPPAGLRTSLAAVLAFGLFAAPRPAAAFCGFYVARADASLWNEASQVALVRDGEHTVITMSNDYQGELTDFALVVPVPVVLEKEQIHVTERKFVERLDAFSAPRLVEYFDDDPCRRLDALAMEGRAPLMALAAGTAHKERARALGVQVEAEYTVGEYDIVILSAKQSDGLETWLQENGYKLPKGASQALAPYIRQGMKFFVAKVNLKEQAKTGYRYLRPLQMAFDSPRFMLPIRLGMLNARGPQDLIIFVLTRKGRVEGQNYRTVKIPSDVEIPTFVKGEFKDFYRDMFRTAWDREGRNVLFTEYFWDMAWCDPCAADPLTPEELRELGVFWLDEPVPAPAPGKPGFAPPRPRPRPGPPGAADVLLTRLHVRYDDARFPEDLVFLETSDRANFQGRYVMRHPWTGRLDCPGGREYVREVRERREREAETLARLTGWPLADIRRKMGELPLSEPAPTPADPWWRKLWK